MNIKKQKIKKKVNVKSHLRTNKKTLTTTIVQQHQRTDEININNEYMKSIGYKPEQNVIKNAMDIDIVNGKYSPNDIIYNTKGGVSDTYKLNMSNNNKSFSTFVKPLHKESLTYKKMYMRTNNNSPYINDQKTNPHIAMYDDKNNLLSIDEIDNMQNDIKPIKNNPYYNNENIKKNIEHNYKGFSAHREIAAIALSKILDMDHINKGALKNLKMDHDEPEFLTFISKDMIADNIQQHEARNTKIEDGITINSSSNEREFALQQLKKHDPEFGNKIMFDYLIGNTDRHNANYFIKHSNDPNNKELKMLGFDHGLTFGNNNKALHEHDFYGQDNYSTTDYPQTKLTHISKDLKVTEKFRNKIKEVINDNKPTKDKNGKIIKKAKSNDIREFIDFIETKIGKNEADMFKERFSNVCKFILENPNDSNIQNLFNKLNPHRIVFNRF